MRGCYHDPCGCGYEAVTGKLVSLCREHSGQWPAQPISPDLEQRVFDGLLPFIRLYSDAVKKRGEQ